MNTLDELKYYINDRNPVGAIMLTGKWKCGKSYLIEHNLRGEVQSSHILLYHCFSHMLLFETYRNEWESNHTERKKRRYADNVICHKRVRLY